MTLLTGEHEESENICDACQGNESLSTSGTKKDCHISSVAKIIKLLTKTKIC